MSIEWYGPGPVVFLPPDSAESQLSVPLCLVCWALRLPACHSTATCRPHTQMKWPLSTNHHIYIYMCIYVNVLKRTYVTTYVVYPGADAAITRSVPHQSGTVSS